MTKDRLAALKAVGFGLATTYRPTFNIKYLYNLNICAVMLLNLFVSGISMLYKWQMPVKTTRKKLSLSHCVGDIVRPEISAFDTFHSLEW